MIYAIVLSGWRSNAKAKTMRHFIAVVRFKTGLFFGVDENYPKIVASFLGLGLGSIVGSMITTLT